jgi:hypothetical protein
MMIVQLSPMKETPRLRENNGYPSDEVPHPNAQNSMLITSNANDCPSAFSSIREEIHNLTTSTVIPEELASGTVLPVAVAYF